MRLCPPPLRGSVGGRGGGGQALACGALVVVLLVLAACSGEPQLRGTPLDPPREAREFALQDQSGRTVSLAGLGGMVVVLTFLYTSCPDLCPLTTGKLRQTYDLLEDTAARVVFVVVTVDPERDTLQEVYDYSERWDMTDRWHFLVGSREELTPLWEYYWVGDVIKEAAEPPAYTQRLASVGPDDHQAGGEALGGQAGAYTLAHAAPIHLIGLHGNVRVVFGSSFHPAELASDIEALLP